MAFFVIRVAFVEAFADKDPRRAAALWSGHPDVVLETGLAEVGETAAAGQPVDKALVSRLVSASAKAPLAPEPFLVRGVEAQVDGDLSRALSGYLAARDRNPRAVAPRYFLAELYLKTGRTGPGLLEISALARLVPDSLPRLIPYLAAFARTQGAAPQVKRLLRDHPQMEAALLKELASDPTNAGLLLYLWSGRSGPDARQWQGRLLEALVEAGQFASARASWTRFMGAAAESGRLFDGEFSTQALPPFGWTLASGASGIAEPQGGGQLHVLYYGREDLSLASQLLTLPAGRYRLSFQANMISPPSKLLAWTVRCLPSGDTVASLPIARSGAASASFSVAGSGCPAQRLELVGKAPGFPERAEATIGQLRLQREGSQ